MNPKETTVSVTPIQFIFAYNYSDNKENRPQKVGYKPIPWIFARFDVSHLATMKKKTVSVRLTFRTSR